MYQPAVTATGSEKLIVTLALVPTSAAPFAGLVDDTVGAVSPPVVIEWKPRPSNVSVAKPSHSIDGSKASTPFVSPAWIDGLRRSVLSIVLVSPEPHSAPGSTPI